LSELKATTDCVFEIEVDAWLSICDEKWKMKMTK